jgi:hypothetical protein
MFDFRPHHVGTSFQPGNGPRSSLWPVGAAGSSTTRTFVRLGDGAIAVRIPKHARKELESYLDCGLLCRGFARLKCEDCGERRLVAFSCRGRAFCPSCTGRRMNATAANLIERVLPPQSALRQWVLTFPFSWRRRLVQDGALFGRLTRIAVETVLTFYAARRRVGSAQGAARSPPCRVSRPICG